jgi:hypothetical protein
MVGLVVTAEFYMDTDSVETLPTFWSLAVVHEKVMVRIMQRFQYEGWDVLVSRIELLGVVMMVQVLVIR